jgi:branched-chain amino acid transport system ATP-binding protein
MSNQNLVSQSEVIMNLKDINLSFGGLKALSEVNLQIKKGEILAIIGPNGAGKSSMLNIISGIYVPK